MSGAKAFVLMLRRGGIEVKFTMDVAAADAELACGMQSRPRWMSDRRQGCVDRALEKVGMQLKNAAEIVSHHLPPSPVSHHQFHTTTVLYQDHLAGRIGRICPIAL